MSLDGGVITSHLLLFGVIKRNKDSKKISIGKNFDEYYYELLAYEESTTKDEIHNYKTTLLFEITTTYFIAILVFYYFTALDFPKMLDWLFIGGLFILAIFYINICWLINLFERNSSELISLLQTLKVEEIVNSSLIKFRIAFAESRKEPGVYFSKILTVNNKNKVLIYYGTELDLSSWHVEDAIKGGVQIDTPEIILLTNAGPTAKAEKVIQENQAQLVIVQFTTEDDLRIQLMKHFYDQ